MFGRPDQLVQRVSCATLCCARLAPTCLMTGIILVIMGSIWLGISDKEAHTIIGASLLGVGAPLLLIGILSCMYMTNMLKKQRAEAARQAQSPQAGTNFQY